MCPSRNPRYKKCFVPKCPTTSACNSKKLYVAVPLSEKKRLLWFKAARREYFSSNKNTRFYCCTDHFKLEEDLENYIKHKMTGCKLTVKEDVVPHIFDWQSDRRTAMSQAPRPLALKRERAELISEVLQLQKNAMENEQSLSSEEVMNAVIIDMQLSTSQCFPSEEPLLYPDDVDNVKSPTKYHSTEAISDIKMEEEQSTSKDDDTHLSEEHSSDEELGDEGHGYQYVIYSDQTNQEGVAAERDSHDPEDLAIEAAEEHSKVLIYVTKTMEGMASSIQRIADMAGLKNEAGTTQKSVGEAAQEQPEKTAQSGSDANSQPQKPKIRKKVEPKVSQVGERKSQRLVNAHSWSRKRRFLEDEEPYEELPEMKTEIDWNYEVDCEPTLAAQLAGQSEERAPQGGEGRAVQQLSAQSRSTQQVPDSKRGLHGECSGPSEEECIEVVKTEMEWDSETYTGPIPSTESEKEKHGHANSRLEEEAGCNNSSLHAADERENKSCLGVQRLDSNEEPVPEIEDELSKTESLCRLCLVELTTFSYIYEFDEIHRFHVADVISDLLGMDLNPDDGYPTKICNACLEELAHFRRFKGKCFNSKSKLKDMVEGNDYHADHMNLGDGDPLYEHEDNVINEIPVPCEAEEIIPGDREVKMEEIQVKCEIQGSDDEELMEGIDSRAKEVDSLLDSCQPRPVVGESQEDVPNSSQQIGKVSVKKEFFIFCDPANASDERDDAFESDVTESGCGQSSEKRKGNNSVEIIGSDKTKGSKRRSPTPKNEDPVPIKIPSNDKQCNNEEVCHGKGETLAS